MAEIVSIYLENKHNTNFNAYKDPSIFDKSKTFIKKNWLIKLVFIISVILVGASQFFASQILSLLQTNKDPEDAILFLLVDPSKANPTDSLSLSVYVKSCQSPIKSVAMSIKYPSAKVTVGNFETKQSAFNEEDENMLTDGLGAIGRSSDHALYGTQLIEKIHMTAKDQIQKNEFVISQDSTVLDTKGKNVLQKSMIISSLDELNLASEFKSKPCVTKID